MKLSKGSGNIVCWFFPLLLLIALIMIFSPTRGICDTFTDDFNDPTTYMLPVNPNTQWRQAGTAFGIFTNGPGFGGAGYSARIIDTEPGYDAPIWGADNAQAFDLSSASVRALMRANSAGGSGFIGFGVYGDTGDDVCAGIAAGFAKSPDTGNAWVFILFDIDEYDTLPYGIAYMPLEPFGIDPFEFHELQVESLTGQVSATLDGTWTLSGTPRLHLDVAGVGIGSNDLGDFSFDNLSLTAQPDDRRVMFQDMQIVEDTPADEVFPSWSRDSKKITYVQDEMDTGPWNVWVKQIEPPMPAVKCTQDSDNAWVFSEPTLSPDYSHVIFEALSDGELKVKRAPADGSGGAEVILSEPGMHWRATDVSGDCNLLLGVEGPASTDTQNLFAVEITPDGLPIAGTERPLTNFPSGLPGAYDAHFDRSCERVVFMSISIPEAGLAQADLYVLNGVQGILNEITQPPIDYSDPRLTLLASGPNFQATDRFSGDGSLVYYCEDVNGTYDLMKVANDPSLPWLEAMSGAHFEIFAVNPDLPTEKIRLNYYRPYSQGLLDASPDGTKLVFFSDKREDGDGVVDADLYIVNLRVQEEISASTGGQIIDGSGSNLDIPAGSLSEDTTISIKTPLPGDIPSPETLPDGLKNIAFARVIEAESETAEIIGDLPILTIHYTDAEIAGLDELSLRIYVYNEDTSRWEPLDNCVVDPVANIVSAPLSHLSIYGVSAALEGTLPVVGSFKPPLTNQEDFALQYGTTLPVKFDVRSQTGAFLSDEPVQAVVVDPSFNKIATFVRGSGSEDIRVDAASELYIFNLHSKDYGLEEGTVYTIIILWNNIPIGEIGFTVDYTKGVGRGKRR